jgi:hypothetical protein
MWWKTTKAVLPK